MPDKKAAEGAKANPSLEVSDSLRGAQKTDKVVKTKIAYAPPMYLRLIRIFVAALIGSTAIGMFTWLYATAYERANFVDIAQYVADKYEGVKEKAPLPPLDERTEIIFPGSSSLESDALDDLKNFVQAMTVQFYESEITEVRRDENVLYFKAGKAEYSIILASPKSYTYFDRLIATGNFDFSRYFESKIDTPTEDNETNG